MTREAISIDQLNARFCAQGVSGRDHLAFVCPCCGTVQSIALLRQQGVPENEIDGYLGFSCVGRFNGAGPWPREFEKQKARTKPGCNWTLGGLLRIHVLEITLEDGSTQPAFALASAEQAQKLEAEMMVAAMEAQS